MRRFGRSAPDFHYTAVRHKPAFFLCELRAAFVSSVVKI